MKIPNITAAKYRTFKIGDDCYEVFLGSVFKVEYSRCGSFISVYDWQDDREVINKLLKMGY